jgi:hypothetical protein
MQEKDEYAIAIPERDYRIAEFRGLEKFLRKAFVTLNERNRVRRNLTNFSIQMAQDLKASLAVLNLSLQQGYDSAGRLSDDQQLMAANAIRRINDITNDALSKYKEAVSENFIDTSVELIVPIMDEIIAEKRAQYAHRPIQFNTSFRDFNKAFAKINIAQFKQVFANILDNAVVAIKERGSIDISLKVEQGEIFFSLSDNGVGIPAFILPYIFDFDISGKNTEEYVGLPAAREVIEGWGGKITIHSKHMVGTQVSFNLPATYAPSWFTDTIFIKQRANLVIIDDDKFIYDMWLKRFEDAPHLKEQINLSYFSNPEHFKEWHVANRNLNNIYLVDYDFINSFVDGIKMMQDLQIMHQAILVTNRYAEAEIRNQCEKLAIKIIPKNFIAHVLLQIEPVQIDNVDIILIDGASFSKKALLQKQPGLVDKNIAAFKNVKEFLQGVSNYPHDIPVYIVSVLHEEIPGEIQAKEIHDSGFKKIYLISETLGIKLEEYPWLSGVV